jgi:hypothetical protein
MPTVVVAALVAMAAVFGAYTVYGHFTREDPVDQVLIVDNSNSFADEVGRCPETMRSEVESAVDQLAVLRIGAFARRALSRPWAFTRDYAALKKKDKVTVNGLEDWKKRQIATAMGVLNKVAAQASHKGTALLEQLESLAQTPRDVESREFAITICGDGEIIDADVDVRKPFDQSKALRTWRNRLRPGLEGATVRIVGFGLGISADYSRRSRRFLIDLLGEAGVASPIAFERGVE